MTVHIKYAQTKLNRFGEKNKMAEIKIRVDQKVLDELDALVEKEDYPSRNALLNEIITQYLTCKGDFFVKSLQSVIASLCRQELKTQSENAEKLLENVTPLFIKILNDLDDIRSIFYAELPEK